MGWIIGLLIVIIVTATVAVVTKEVIRRKKEIDGLKVAINFLAPPFSPQSKLKKIRLKVIEVSAKRLSPPVLVGTYQPRGSGIFNKLGMETKYLGETHFNDQQKTVDLFSNTNTLMPSHYIALGYWKIVVVIDEWIEEFDKGTSGTVPANRKAKLYPLKVEDKFEVKASNRHQDPQGHFDLRIDVVSGEDPQSTYSLTNERYHQVGMVK